MEKERTTGEKEGKKGFSLVQKLLCLSIIPTVALGVVIAIYAAASIVDGMQDEFLSGLRNSSLFIRSAYDALDEGAYALDENGDLVKGGLNVTAQEELLDSFIKDTDMAVTFFYGDTRMATSLIDKESGKRIVGTQAAQEVTDAVLKRGEEYTATDIVINGSNYYACYIPLKNGSEVIGMVFVGAPSEDINTFITEKVRNIIILCLLILALVAVVVVRAALKISNSIKDMEKAVVRISQGDLTTVIDPKSLKRSDEIGVMARALRDTIDKLSEIIREITRSATVLMKDGHDLENMASQTSNTSDEVSRAVEEIAKGAIVQAEGIERATGLVSDMGEQIERIAGNIQLLYQTSEQMQSAGKYAEDNMKEFTVSNEQTNTAIGKVAENVKKTDESVNTIADALSLITDIADETNLLSLNASIEAARAGESGRGFAVVAEQIKNLAEQSNQSAKTIEGIINNLLEESQQAVKTMNTVDAIIGFQADKVEMTKRVFDKVNEGLLVTVNGIEAIASTTKVLDDARGQVMSSVESLSAIAEENAAATQETAASAEELAATIGEIKSATTSLNKVADDLTRQTNMFQIYS